LACNRCHRRSVFSGWSYTFGSAMRLMARFNAISKVTAALAFLTAPALHAQAVGTITTVVGNGTPGSAGDLHHAIWRRTSHCH
jgi:hypothetical protein